MKSYAVSDIHGNSERLAVLFDVLKKKHPKNDFKLYVIGDLFDRGDDSDEVLSLLHENYDNVKVLKGNHEALFMAFMQNPIDEYINWQMNYSYSTVASFALRHFQNLYEQFADAKDAYLILRYFNEYSKLDSKLSKKFNLYGGKHSIEAYVNQITKTVSSRDIRNVGTDLRRVVATAFKGKSKDYIKFFEKYLYVRLLDDFCNVYDYFDSLDKYAVVDDKFLLVHSGYVSKNINPHVRDSIPEELYNECATVEDLAYQSEVPMIWARRTCLKEEKLLTPDERFDGKIIVFGHTTTNNLNADKSADVIFTYDVLGKLASVGIDGGNYGKLRGRLNCLCMNDLSQIVIKGGKDLPEKIAIEEIPYQDPTGFGKE